METLCRPRPLCISPWHFPTHVLSFDTSSPPCHEAQRKASDEAGERKPQKCGVCLRLMTPSDTIRRQIDLMFLIDAAVDDHIADEVRTRLIGVMAGAGMHAKLSSVSLQAPPKNGSAKFSNSWEVATTNDSANFPIDVVESRKVSGRKRRTYHGTSKSEQ